MQKIKAITIGMKAMKILSVDDQRGFVGTVHSVFSHSFNVIGAAGLMTVVHTNVHHPAAVNLEDGPQSFLQVICVGWDVQRELWGFSVLKPSGKTAMSVDTSMAKCWDGGTTMASREQLAALVRSRAATTSGASRWESLKQVSKAYTQWGRGGGLGELIPLVCGQTWDLEVTISKAFGISWIPVAELITAIKHNHLRGLCSAVWSLFGMGPGLTPSGDDLLVGLIASWVLVGDVLGIPSERVSTLHRIISKYSLTRTSTLSMHLLDYACKGLVCDLFYRLICALALQTNDVFMRSRAALQWGGTSGEDTTLGICIAFRLAPGWVAAES